MSEVSEVDVGDIRCPKCKARFRQGHVTVRQLNDGSLSVEMPGRILCPSCWRPFSESEMSGLHQVMTMRVHRAIFPPGRWVQFWQRLTDKVQELRDILGG